MPALAQCWDPLPLDALLARLAANQDRAVEGRRLVVYQQTALVRLLRTNGKLAREERRRYTVTPAPQGTEKKLDHFEGLYEKGGRLLPYAAPGFQYKDLDLDGELIQDLTEDLIDDHNSRDGISHDLFPLTSGEQRHYSFRMAGCRPLAGRPALYLTFTPRKDPGGGGARAWAGELYLDPAEFQPLMVTTRFAGKIPRAVKILFGVEVKQLGFSVTFRKVDDNLWFPTTYGSEFGIKVLFGYKRNITINVANTDFRKTTVSSEIVFPEIAPPAP